MAWLAGYDYRKKLTLTHTGAIAGFQRDFSIIKATAGANGIENHASNWPNDVRFTASDGTTLLDFWRVESDATDGTWMVEYDQADGDTEVYLYYGKVEDTDASSATNTCLFFDDFATLDNYDVVTEGTGAVTLADGVVHFNCPGDTDVAKIARKVTDTSESIIVGGCYRFVSGNGGNAHVGLYHQATEQYGDCINDFSGATVEWKWCLGGGFSRIDPRPQWKNVYKIHETYYSRNGGGEDKFRARILGDVWHDVGWYVTDGASMKSGAGAKGTTGTSTGNATVGDIDYIYTRKYVATEPTMTWGSEEVRPVPTGGKLLMLFKA